MLYTNDLRFWDVTLPPGQATQPFVHDYDVATVVIGDGTLNIQRNGEALTPPAPNARGSVIVAEHTGAPGTYRIENSGTTEYRAFEIENMHEGNWPAAHAVDRARFVGVEAKPRVHRLRPVLRADAPDVTHDHTGATIIILISGTLQQGGIGGTDPVRIQQVGQWLRFRASRPTASVRPRVSMRTRSRSK